MKEKTQFGLNIFLLGKQILFTLNGGQNLISEHFGGVLTL
jgi:hypothetical protein